jgi:Tfp pilus assembly protein PilO
MSLGMLALTFIIDLKQLPILFFAALMVMVVVPIVYSFVIFKQQKKIEH